MNEPVLSVSLTVDYPRRPGVLRDVQFSLDRGRILGLAGLSGSGKSTLALSVLRLVRAELRGEIRFAGQNLLTLPENAMRQVRGRQIGFIPQNPAAALNPLLRIGTQLTEAWQAHQPRLPKTAMQELLLDRLAEVSLPRDPELLRRYPRQLSVGMAQRVLIAMALLHRPALLLADEPTSALDVISQAEVLRLLQQLNRDLGVAMLYISHDLPSTANLCHEIAILHQGQLVEQATPTQLFTSPRHPFTQTLVAAVPHLPTPYPVQMG